MIMMTKVTIIKHEVKLYPRKATRDDAKQMCLPFLHLRIFAHVSIELHFSSIYHRTYIHNSSNLL